jgi:hypothetical protein
MAYFIYRISLWRVYFFFFNSDAPLWHHAYSAQAPPPQGYFVQWQEEVFCYYNKPRYWNTSVELVTRSLPRRVRNWRSISRRVSGQPHVFLFVGKPEGRRPLARPRRKWEDNIKTDLRVVGWEAGTGSIWLRTATGGGILWRRWLTLGSIKFGVFLTSWALVRFSGRTLLHGVSE